MSTKSKMQSLLDLEAKLNNLGMKSTSDYDVVIKEIENLRGSEHPFCYGHDDCPTLRLVSCPWRMSCGG